MNPQQPRETRRTNPSSQALQMPLGGYLIDAQGREVAITEAMVRQACEALESSRRLPSRAD